MENNVKEKLVVPEVPRVVDVQKVMVYLPMASHSNAGAAKFDATSFRIKDDGTVALRRNPVRTIVDFTVDKVTGKGTITYDDGTSISINFPTLGDDTVKLGLINIVNFEESSFVYDVLTNMYYISIPGNEIEQSDSEYFAFIEEKVDNGYETDNSSLFKSLDGSLLISSPTTFSGRVLILSKSITTSIKSISNLTNGNGDASVISKLNKEYVSGGKVLVNEANGDANNGFGVGIVLNGKRNFAGGYKINIAGDINAAFGNELNINGSYNKVLARTCNLGSETANVNDCVVFGIGNNLNSGYANILFGQRFDINGGQCNALFGTDGEVSGNLTRALVSGIYNKVNVSDSGTTDGLAIIGKSIHLNSSTKDVEHNGLILLGKYNIDTDNYYADKVFAIGCGTEEERRNVFEILSDGTVLHYDKTTDKMVEFGKGGNASVEVDSELSLESTNPVQNKVVAEEFERKLTIDDAKQTTGGFKASLVYTNDTTKHYLGSSAQTYKTYNVPMIYGSTAGDTEPLGYLITHAPQNKYHCANKQYVDEKIAEVGGECIQLPYKPDAEQNEENGFFEQWGWKIEGSQYLKFFGTTDWRDYLVVMSIPFYNDNGSGCISGAFIVNDYYSPRGVVPLGNIYTNDITLGYWEATYPSSPDAFSIVLSSNMDATQIPDELLSGAKVYAIKIA